MMLYVFVQGYDVLFATYDHDTANKFCRFKTIRLRERYFDDVEIYEVLDNDD